MQLCAPYFRRKSQSAFTLVEVIIGITILTIVLVAIAVLTITAIRINRANINRLTSYYLAQEGLEGFRNMRDSNWAQNYSWNGGDPFWGSDFTNVDGAGTFHETLYYVLDYEPEVTFTGLQMDGSPWRLQSPYLSSEDALSHAQLFWEDGHYTHVNSASAVPSFYSRYMEVTYDEGEGADRAQITAVVVWQENGEDRSIEVSTELTDWKEGPL